MVAQRHLKVVFGGSIEGEGKADEWSCGLSMTVPSNIWEGGVMDQPKMDDVHADVVKYWTAIRSKFPVGVRLVYVKANIIGSDGFYVDKAQTWRKDVEPAMPGSGSSASLPWQTALVVSTRTAVSRGPGSKGRWFLPVPSTAILTNSGNIDTTTKNVIGQASAQFVADLNNWPGLDWAQGPGSPVVAIVSDGGKSAVPIARAVTGVRVGDRLDTQRRRANDTLEVYTPFALP